MSDPKAPTKPYATPPAPPARDESQTRKDAMAIAKELIAEVMPAIAVAMKKSDDKAAAVVEDLGQCPACRQKLAACKDKHRRMNVMVHVNSEYFPGIKLNGITYLGDSIVPANVNFEYQLQQWDVNEDSLRNGRKRVRHSGSVGNSGTSVKPLTAEDFFR